ncbi:DUF5134 domain-containing protein [soil metagenome]
MIADLALRWLVTALFGLSVAESALSLAAGHHRRTSVVGHVLHLVMAVAMIVMAWPFGMTLPTRPPLVFFVVAALWFAGVAVASAGPVERLGNEYHAVMMAAMAWMYAVMDGALFATAPADSDAPTATMPTMPGMDMSSGGASPSTAEPQWITALNWMFTVGFGLAAAFWLYRYLACRRREVTIRPALLAHAGSLAQAFMAAGMAIMFGVML